MQHRGTEYLENDKIILRRFVKEDVSFVYDNWMSDEKIFKHIKLKKHNNIDESRAMLESYESNYEKKDFYMWAIIPRGVNQPIGAIGAHGFRMDTGQINMVYSIGSKWWNKGYMTQALSMVIEFLFNQVGVNRIQSTHDIDNLASGKVMHKCGMKKEGVLRQAELNNRGIHDSVVYSVLKSEYEEPQ